MMMALMFCKIKLLLSSKMLLELKFRIVPWCALTFTLPRYSEHGMLLRKLRKYWKVWENVWQSEKFRENMPWNIVNFSFQL